MIILRQYSQKMFGIGDHELAKKEGFKNVKDYRFWRRRMSESASPIDVFIEGKNVANSGLESVVSSNSEKAQKRLNTIAKKQGYSSKFVKDAQADLLNEFKYNKRALGLSNQGAFDLINSYDKRADAAIQYENLKRELKTKSLDKMQQLVPGMSNKDFSQALKNKWLTPKERQSLSKKGLSALKKIRVR